MSEQNKSREFWVFPDPLKNAEKLGLMLGDHIALSYPSKNLIHTREVLPPSPDYVKERDEAALKAIPEYLLSIEVCLGHLKDAFRDGSNWANDRAQSEIIRYKEISESSHTDAEYEALQLENNNFRSEIESLKSQVKVLEKAFSKLDEEFFLKIITDWKHLWMDQTQNSKEDFENYHRRAFGVDANMKYSLAKRLVDALEKMRGGG